MTRHAEELPIPTADAQSPPGGPDASSRRVCPAALLPGCAATIAGSATPTTSQQVAPTSDTIEWSITSPNGASAVLIGGTLVDSHRVTWPSVQLPSV